MLKSKPTFMRNNLTLSEKLGVRSVKKQDQPFLESLFLSARPHLQSINLPDPLLAALIKQQYSMQQNHYRTQWPHAEKLIITQARAAIGQLMLAESDSCLHIIDLALLPSYRRKGIGRSLLSSLQQAAKIGELLLKLSVDKQNILAKKLYLSMGFQLTEQTETHCSMSWTPPR